MYMKWSKWRSMSKDDREGLHREVALGPKVEDVGLNPVIYFHVVKVVEELYEWT